MTEVCFDNDSYGRAIQLAAKEQRASKEESCSPLSEITRELSNNKTDNIAKTTEREYIKVSALYSKFN